MYILYMQRAALAEWRRHLSSRSVISARRYRYDYRFRYAIYFCIFSIYGALHRSNSVGNSRRVF